MIKFIVGSFLVILMAALIALTVVGIDELAAGGKYTAWVFYKKSCNTVLGPEATLVYSESEKAYAIKINRSYGRENYLCSARWGITDYPITISKPAMFVDSCRAKTYYLKWVAQNSPTVPDFNNVK